MALLTNGLDDGALVPPGEYVKADGGVRFSVTRDATFVFRGEAQAIEARYDVRGRPCFEIYWQWGRPTFSLDADGALVEDGRHVFRRAGEPPARAATPEQLCHLRDAGYVVLHGCVPSAAVDAALRSGDVASTIRKAGADGTCRAFDSFRSFVKRSHVVSRRRHVGRAPLLGPGGRRRRALRLAGRRGRRRLRRAVGRRRRFFSRDP